MWDTLSSCSWAATAAAASPVSRCCSTIQTNQVTGHNLQIEHEHLYWFHPTFQASKDMKIQSQGKAYPRARRSCCAKARGNAQAPHRTRHSPSAIHCSDSMLIFLHRHKWQVHSLSSSIAQITRKRASEVWHPYAGQGSRDIQSPQPPQYLRSHQHLLLFILQSHAPPCYCMRFAM